MLAKTVIQASRLQCRSLSMFPTAVDVPLPQAVEPATLYAPSISGTSLGNGASIVARHSRADNVSLKFALSSGSRHELFPEKGAAHLLAHSAFAGTQKESGLRLMRSLENCGCTVSASANREQIIFSVNSPLEFVDFALEKVSDAVFSAPKYSHTIEERKSVAEIDYQELKQNPQLVLTELLHEAAYGDGTPMGASMYASDLKRLDVDDVMEFRLRNFVTSNLVVLADGIALNTLETSLQKKLSSAEVPPIAAIPSPFTGGSVRVRADLGGDTHVALAFPAPAGAAGKAFTVLKEVLGARLKDKNSQGNFVSSFGIPYSDGGMVGAYMASSTVAGAEELLSSVIGELKSIAKSCDVTSAANKLTLSNFVALEGGSTAADIMLAAKVQQMDSLDYADLRNVTAKDVSAAAATVLESNPAVAVLGATYGFKSFDNIKAFMQ